MITWEGLGSINIIYTSCIRSCYAREANGKGKKANIIPEELCIANEG
jgi:hypothetical protein